MSKQRHGFLSASVLFPPPRPTINWQPKRKSPPLVSVPTVRGEKGRGAWVYCVIALINLPVQQFGGFCVNFLPSDSRRRWRTAKWDEFLVAPEKEWRSVSEWVKWAWAIIISEFVNCVINYGEECRQWIRNTTQQQMDYFWPSTTTTRRRRSSGRRRKTNRVKKR